MLSNKLIRRCYFPKDVHVLSKQLLGFCDASEEAYVQCSCCVCTYGRHSWQCLHLSCLLEDKGSSYTAFDCTTAGAVWSQSTYLPIYFTTLGKYLEYLLTMTDSKVVLGWLAGNPRRFKTFVSNRVSNILELLSPDRWHHIPGSENPADCASRGLFPSELLHHKLWWNGPEWMQAPKSQWPMEDVATGTPLKWPLARVTSVFPGEDGLVRVVTIKTGKGTYKRPANKISLILPIEH